MNALCIVDIQPPYLSGHKLQIELLLHYVEHQMLKAMKRRDPIFIIEYSEALKHRHGGSTHEQLIKFVARYKKHWRVTKHKTSGVDAIGKQCQELGISPTSFTVCGVETDCCVRHTACGLANLGYSVTIPAKATHDPYSQSSAIKNIREMKVKGQVTIV